MNRDPIKFPWLKILLVVALGACAQNHNSEGSSTLTQEDRRKIDSTAKAKTAVIMAGNEAERTLRPIYHEIEDCDKSIRERAYRNRPLPNYYRDSKAIQKIKNDGRAREIEAGEKAYREDIANHFNISLDSLKSIERMGTINKWYVRK